MGTGFRARAEAKRHQLKCEEQYFEAQLDGTKSYEIRLMDRDFRVGDEIDLLEMVIVHGEPETVKVASFDTHITTWGIEAELTGRTLGLIITSILEEFDGLEEGYGILGTAPLTYTSGIDIDKDVEAHKEAVKRAAEACLSRTESWVGSDGEKVPLEVLRDTFNLHFKYGEKVLYTDDLGIESAQTINSLAWVEPSSVVVALEGEGGDYDIGRIKKSEFVADIPDYEGED